MDTNLLLKIAGVGLLVTVLVQILTKAGREDMAMLTTLAGIVIVLFTVISLVGDLLNKVKTIFHLT